MNGPIMRILITDAKRDLEDRMRMHPGEYNVDHLIHELANPSDIYYSTIMSLALEDTSLALEEPTREYKTPMEGIQSNVTDRIMCSLYEYLSEIDVEEVKE